MNDSNIGSLETASLAQVEPKDAQLVENYKLAVEQFGRQSNQAEMAFSYIFKRYYVPLVSIARSKRVNEIYQEDLAQATLITVYERLNGKEVVTNLRGLVMHSLMREHSTMMEKLYQGRRLTNAGITGSEPVDNDAAVSLVEGEAVPKRKIVGASISSLNKPLGTDADGVEHLNLVADENFNVEDEAARLELVHTLHLLIDQMPAKYRDPLVCQWIEGMKIKDVAEKLNLTLDQVKKSTAKGMVWLKNHIDGTPDDWII